jgi:membrane protein implicated in regulation of membrane protease activity
MGIGGCVIVFALGAIFTFGVNWHVAGVNLHVIGVILMIAGLLGLFTFASLFRRRGPIDRGAEEEIVTQRRYYDGP